MVIGGGAADLLFDNILKVRKWTVQAARNVAAKGGLRLHRGQSILQHMTLHLQR